MKQYYLHIGLHKTGSTFIQKKILEKISSENHHIITPSCKINEKILDFIRTKDLNLKNNIQEYFEKIKKPKIIYSCEALFGYMMNGYKDASLRFEILEELFRNPKYIIFYREPSEIIYSCYFQGLRGLYLYENFVEYSTKEIKFLHNEIPKNFSQGTNYKLFDYNELLKDYLAVKDRVLFVNYNDFYFKDRKKSLHTIENFLGLKLNIKINFKKKSNPSQKKLIYFIFYNKYILFKVFKIIILNFFLTLSKFKILKKLNFRHIIAESIVLVIVLFNLFFKIFNSKKLEEYEKKILDHKEFIKSNQMKNYEKFKKIIQFNNER